MVHVHVFLVGSTKDVGLTVSCMFLAFAWEELERQKGIVTYQPTYIGTVMYWYFYNFPALQFVYMFDCFARIVQELGTVTAANVSWPTYEYIQSFMLFLCWCFKVSIVILCWNWVIVCNLVLIVIMCVIVWLLNVPIENNDEIKRKCLSVHTFREARKMIVHPWRLVRYMQLFYCSTSHQGIVQWYVCFCY